VPDNLRGRKIRCPGCKNISVVATPPDFSPGPAGPSAGARAGSPAPDGAEPVMVVCPRCAAWIEVPEQQLGRSVTCSQCLQVVPTPLPSDFSSRTVATPVAARAAAAASATADDRTATAPRGKPDGKGVQPGPSASPDPASPSFSALEGKRDSRKRKKKKRKRASSWLPAISVEAGFFKPFLLLGIVVVAVVGLIFALRTIFEKGGAPPTIPPDAWQAYEVKDRLLAALPVPFRTSQQDVPVLGGDVAIHVQSNWPEREQAANAIYTQSYSVGHSPKALPATLRVIPEKDLLNRICDDLVTKGGAPDDKEIKRRPITLESYPGMELIVDVRHGKRVTRVYLAHNRIYLVAAGGRGIEPNQPNVKRLFESFQIVDTGKEAEPPKPTASPPPKAAPKAAPKAPPRPRLKPD
jgi:predicted Zn finger-like uncharacterized protein